MKRCMLAVLLIAVCTLGCGTAANPLVGSWRLVTMEHAAGGPAAESGAPLKVLSDSNFAFGFMMSDGSVYAGGGRYTHRNGVYTESVEYHSDPWLLGRTLEFKCVLEGDTWYHSGTFDIEGRSYRIDEVWQRVTR